MTDQTPDLTDRQRDILEALPASTPELSEKFGIADTTIEGHRNRLNDKPGIDLVLEREGDAYVWHNRGEFQIGADNPDPPEWVDTPIANDDPDPEDLTERQRYIVRQLQTGADPDDLASDLDIPDTLLTEHLRDLRQRGWQVYHDETAKNVAIEGDHTLRSSEHKGTRTRKANKWWELRHNALVREFKGLQTPTATLDATAGHEDWVTHLTDLHAGDRVRGYEGGIVHETEDLPPLIDHITERSISLAEKHGSTYDTAYPLWTGDFVTNSGIYESQFENLDAWLDEQVDILHDPLLRQIKTLSAEFPAVHVVCQPGNHGDIRASGSSKQANADLLVYKSVRNTVAALQELGHLENVEFTIGRAGSITPFRLRGGEIHGQLRHGEDRSPQADTSARKKEWISTILDSLNAGDAFDLCWMGHHHVSGRLPWNGPPVIITGSPKPGGEYPRKLGEMTGPNTKDIAHVHGVSDDGLTGVYPIDTRHYSR